MTTAEIVQWGAVIGAIGAALSLWTKLRQSATEVAVWRNNTDRDIQALRTQIETHRDSHTADSEEAREFRRRVYDWMRTTDIWRVKVSMKLRIDDEDDE